MRQAARRGLTHASDCSTLLLGCRGAKAAHRLSTPRGLLLCGAVPCRLHACYFYLSFVACLLGARSMLTGKVAHGQTDQVDLGPDGL